MREEGARERKFSLETRTMCGFATIFFFSFLPAMTTFKGLFTTMV